MPQNFYPATYLRAQELRRPAKEKNIRFSISVQGTKSENEQPVKDGNVAPLGTALAMIQPFRIIQPIVSVERYTMGGRVSPDRAHDQKRAAHIAAGEAARPPATLRPPRAAARRRRPARSRTRTAVEARRAPAASPASTGRTPTRIPPGPPRPQTSPR